MVARTRLASPSMIDGPVDAGFGSLHGIELVVNGGCGAGQVVNLVHLHVEGEGDVMAHELELRVVEQIEHILLGARVEVVDAQDLVALTDQPLHTGESREIRRRR